MTSQTRILTLLVNSTDAVEELGRAPSRVRTDCAAENVFISVSQFFLRRHHNFYSASFQRMNNRLKLKKSSCNIIIWIYGKRKLEKWYLDSKPNTVDKTDKKHLKKEGQQNPKRKSHQRQIEIHISNQNREASRWKQQKI